MAITHESFAGGLWPTEVLPGIFADALAGSPFFDSLTRLTIAGASATFGVANPSGFDWTPELGEIPTVDPGDDALVVVPTKLAGIVRLSNESVADASFPLASELARLIRDGMAGKVDDDVLNGAGPAPEPVGILPGLVSGAVDESTLRAAVIGAAGELIDAGGTPTHVAVSGGTWAEEAAREGANGPSYRGGDLFGDLGMVTVKVPAMPTGQALVYDRSRVYGVVRRNYSIDFDTSGDAFAHDAVDARVLVRLALAAPAPSRSLRLATVAGGS